MILVLINEIFVKQKLHFTNTVYLIVYQLEVHQIK